MSTVKFFHQKSDPKSVELGNTNTTKEVDNVEALTKLMTSAVATLNNLHKSTETLGPLQKDEKNKRNLAEINAKIAESVTKVRKLEDDVAGLSEIKRVILK